MSTRPSPPDTQGFPRGIPRGLIEASDTAKRSVGAIGVFRGVFPAASLKRGAGLVPGRIAGLVFRGVFPAASLKRRSHGGRPAAAPRFPRGIPRGLIEAGRGRGRSLTTLGVFRGVFPAASLKRPQWTATRGPSRRVFRGVFPAASLKHLVFSAGRDAHRGFSAGYSPRPH